MSLEELVILKRIIWMGLAKFSDKNILEQKCADLQLLCHKNWQEPCYGARLTLSCEIGTFALTTKKKIFVTNFFIFYLERKCERRRIPHNVLSNMMQIFNTVLCDELIIAKPENRIPTH